MNWVFDVRAGKLFLPDCTVAGVGYSGRAGKWRNDPDYQAVHYFGPIPVGMYSFTVEPANSHRGLADPVLRFTPVGHNAFGRTGLLSHGNNAANDASEGCLILDHAERGAMAASENKMLEVRA